MKKSNKAWIIIAAVLVIGGGILLLKALKKPKNNDFDVKPKPTPPTVATPSDFPLKNGSRGDLVKKLQNYLGVMADGIFGPKTEAALKAATGKTSVASAAELDALIAKAATQAQKSANTLRAEKLVSDFKNGGRLTAIASVRAYGLIEDTYGALNLTGKDIVLNANMPMNRADHIPLSATMQGYLKFKITGGDTAGLYKVDPNKMTIV